MTIPGGINQIKTPVGPGTMSTGTMTTQVQVQSVNTEVSPPVATCVDNARRPIPVRMDVQRGKGSIPAVGEFWVIDKSLGVWTFCAYLGGDPSGAGMGSIGSITGLSDALDQHDADLTEQHARLDTMWTQGTITAIQGTTNADVTLTDGTSVPGAQVVGSYAPKVGDTVWTAGVDGAGSRAIVGVSASSAVNEQVTNLVATGTVSITGALTAGTLNVAGWRALYDAYQNSAWITGAGGSGIVSAGTTLYVVTASDTSVHAPLWASTLTADGVINGGGWYIGPSSTSRPAILSSAQNAGIVALNGIIYVSQYNDTTLRADLIAGNITATGSMNTNGINTSSMQVGAAGTPADRQIRTVDLTATNNINVLNTFYYKGVAQNMNPASERSLKHHIEALGDPFEYLDRLAPSRFRFIDTEHFDSREHVGVMVDEMAEGDESTVIYPVTIPDGMEPDEITARARRNHGRVPDERALIAYLVRATQLLVQRVRDLERGEEVGRADAGTGER